MTGIEQIAREREHQIKKGLDKYHDSFHKSDHLIFAAIAYALISIAWKDFTGLAISLWPWDMEFWNPKSRKKNLIRSGALIAAAIDRIESTSDPIEKKTFNSVVNWEPYFRCGGTGIIE